MRLDSSNTPFTATPLLEDSNLEQAAGGGVQALPLDLIMEFYSHSEPADCKHFI